MVGAAIGFIRCLTARCSLPQAKFLCIITFLQCLGGIFYNRNGEIKKKNPKYLLNNALHQTQRHVSLKSLLELLLDLLLGDPLFLVLIVVRYTTIF